MGNEEIFFIRFIFDVILELFFNTVDTVVSSRGQDEPRTQLLCYQSEKIKVFYSHEQESSPQPYILLFINLLLTTKHYSSYN